MTVDSVIEAVVKGTQGRVQERTRRGMGIVLTALGRGTSYQDATVIAGVQRRSVDHWRKTYPIFDAECRRMIELNAVGRKRAREEQAAREREEAGLVLRRSEPVPDRGTLAEFRRKYFGRPTPPHQQAAVRALEDRSNLYVFIFGPTGMGKDTLAGDYVAWELAPDRSGLRVAWFMETSDFSERRLGRLSRYLTDSSAYWLPPEDTPGGQVPSGSLIDDFGPFRWEPGMMWDDGTEVARTRWTSTAKYFVRSVAPEQDPNLWATGVEGAAYGSRIGLCVCSDMFTKENQKSPTERKNQYEWFDGTLDTRLDARGRLVVIGTMLPIENNYELILDNYLAGAQALREERIGPGVYTKYDNGCAVVVVKAIVRDPETGVEESYWPEQFPLSDQLIGPDGKAEVIDQLTETEVLERADAGYRRERGLRSKRTRSPLVFKSMFQQERDRQVESADFTEEVLIRAHDDLRSFGQVLPHEIKLLGVDPARRYGAAWVLLAVDKTERQITIADFWWGQKLGYTGIKEDLILKPLSRFNPSWLCYEDNREGSVLGDTVIWKVINSSGVSLYPHNTGQERGNIDVGPGAMATWMDSLRLRIPYATGEDRARAEELEAQFKAWDKNPDRSKPGQAGHDPDDLCMACWVAWLKAAPMVDDDPFNTGIIRGVPAAIKRRYDRAAEEVRALVAAKRGQKVSPRDALVRGRPLEMIRALGGETDDD